MMAVKKCFFSPFDLHKIDVFDTNHYHIMVGRVFHIGSTMNHLSKKKQACVLF
jgi:hypothetical protein